MPLEDPDWLARSSDAVKRMHGYWRPKCGSDRMPKRCAIDPVEIPRFLPHVTIVEVVSGERRYVYLLVGTKEVEIRGLDPPGKSVIAGFFGPPLQDALGRHAGSTTTTRHITPDGRFSDDETLFLPLSEDGDRVRRVLALGTFSPGPKP